MLTSIVFLVLADSLLKSVFSGSRFAWSDVWHLSCGGARRLPPQCLLQCGCGSDWIGLSNVPRGSVKRSTWVLVFQVWLHSNAFVPCHPCLMCSCSWCSGFFSLAHFLEQERACHFQLLVNYLPSSYVHSNCQSIHYVVRIVSMPLHTLLYGFIVSWSRYSGYCLYCKLYWFMEVLFLFLFSCFRVNDSHMPQLI